MLLSFVGETRGPADYWTTFLPGLLVFGRGVAFTVAPLTTTVMTSVDDEYSGTASGINNAISRISNVFANAIFGALVVLLFAGALQKRLDGMALAVPVRQEVMRQTSDLGYARVPASVDVALRPRVGAAYRDGFIDACGRVMKMAAGLAFGAAIVAAVFVRRRPAGAGQ
jgi:hypothetical protein